MIPADIRLLLLCFVAVGLLAGACGGDEPGGPGTPRADATVTAAATAVSATAAPATTPVATATPGASPIATRTPSAAVTRTGTAATAPRTATSGPGTATPTGTATPPFPAATVIPGPIEMMMGGRIESPRPGETVRSPLSIRGFANAFEGAVLLVLRDKHGAVVERIPATGAMGSFGAFNVALSASLDAARSPYTLEMTVASPRDGSTSVLAQVPVVAGSPASTGPDRLSGGPLPGTIRLSQPRVRNVTAGGFEVEFVSSSPCRGAVFFPAELAGRTAATTQASDEQRLATYHIVRVDARVLGNLERGRRYRWYITCENTDTNPASPPARVSLPFDQALP